jgi:hypothetical protein
LQYKSSSSSFPVLGLLRPVTGVTKLNPSIFSKVQDLTARTNFKELFFAVFKTYESVYLSAIMCLHNAHKMNARRADHDCPSVCMFQPENHWMVFSYICYEHYTTRNHHTHLYLLISYDKEKRGKVRVPLDTAPWSHYNRALKNSVALFFVLVECKTTWKPREICEWPIVSWW